MKADAVAAARSIVRQAEDLEELLQSVESIQPRRLEALRDLDDRLRWLMVAIREDEQ